MTAINKMNNGTIFTWMDSYFKEYYLLPCCMSVFLVFYTKNAGNWEIF